MYVYDNNNQKLLMVSSAKLEWKADAAIVFKSADGESIEARCKSLTDGCEYMHKLSELAYDDVLIAVDSSTVIGGTTITD